MAPLSTEQKSHNAHWLEETEKSGPRAFAGFLLGGHMAMFRAEDAIRFLRGMGKTGRLP